MADVEACVVELQGLVAELTSEGVTEAGTEELAEKLLSILDCPALLDLKNAQYKTAQQQIEQSAVSLWYVAVVGKSSGKHPHTLNAKLRHVSCRLALLSNTGNTDVGICQKQTMMYIAKRTVRALTKNLLLSTAGQMMALKTGRAWLDCGNYNMADSVLMMANDCIEKLRSLLLQSIGPGGDTSAIDKKKQEIEADLLKVLVYKAEASCGQGQQKAAMELIHQAKELLHRLPQESGFLSMLCYNFGVECFQRQQYEDSVIWLRQSYDIGKVQNSVGPQNQSRTLRLLAHAYLDWDAGLHWHKALSAIELANTEYSLPAGMFMKVRILLEGKVANDRIKQVVDDIMQQPELTSDFGLSTVRILMQHDKSDLTFDFLRHLANRMQNTPDYGKVSVTHLEMLLRVGKLQDARQLMEQCITGHNTGNPLDETTRKQFHSLLWERAAQDFEANSFEAALQWYNYSWSLFSKEEEMESNLAKLHRNRASCYINLDQLHKAEEAIGEAEKSDSSSPYTQYFRFKVSILLGQDDKALEAMQNMGKTAEASTLTEKDNIHGLICLAAQMAFQQSNRSVAVSALENLVRYSPDTAQVLTSLRCLTRLKLTFLQEDTENHDIATITSYLRTAYDKLRELQEAEVLEASINLTNEATWFMKIAWNTALQCEENHRELHDLFLLCSKLTKLCGEEMAGLVRQKTCLLMASAANLQIAKNVKQQVDKEAVYRETLAEIEQCREVCDKLQGAQHTDADNKSRDTTTPVLLVLYEFEARVKLDDPRVEAVFDRALSLPQSDPKAFETIAALAMEPPADNKSLSTRALKVALKKYLKGESVDFQKCSKAYHSLVHLSLQGSSTIDPVGRDEARTYYNEVLDILQNKAEGRYPEMEILWLMTKAWNCGIHLYSAQKHEEALQWCELGLRLLQYLGPLKSSYETQMTNVYGEILSKLDPKKGDIAVRI